MARHRAEHESDEPTARSDADETPDTEDDAPGDDAEDTPTGDDSVEEPERTAEVAEFWSELAIEPIEVALPSGVGYTLRAYRSPDEVEAVPGASLEPAEEADEEAAAEPEPEPEESATPAAKAKSKGKGKGDEDESEEEDESADDESTEPADDDAEDADSEEEDTEGDEDEGEEPAGPDEVPVFLAQQGKLLLFRTPEGLAAFVRSDEPHTLRGVEQADTLADRIAATHVAPDDDDRYELDLLVKNLRGGHDSWEPELVISAGELARDLAYALDLQSVQTSLAPGSPLDDLDEAMRGVAKGGLGAFRARRRMRKIGAQQASLAWRTIIGKISAAVDWRD